MQTVFHAVGWALPRLGIALGVIILVPLLAYVLLVVAIVVGQAASAFGQ